MPRIKLTVAQTDSKNIPHSKCFAAFINQQGWPANPIQHPTRYFAPPGFAINHIDAAPVIKIQA
jgi:hypothetical protein